MDIVTELKTLRETKGISQATVAAEVGCDQATVSHWEQGKHGPSGSARKLITAYIETLRGMPDATPKTAEEAA